MTAMHQQINLYQPVFRRQQKVFSAATLLQIGAAVLVLLLTLLGHAHWALADMQHTADALDEQVTGLNRQLGALEAANRTPDSTALADEIARLQDDIAQRNSLLEQFDRLVTRNEAGFAARFEALAQEHLPGLWLDGITVDNDNRVELRGMTLDARLVPHYLQQLEQRNGLSEKPFETVSMTRMESGAPQLQFVLRNFKGDVAWHQP